MAKKSRKAVKEDLLLTLDSDSEVDKNDVGSDSDAEFNSNKERKNKEINPDFQFSLDGFESAITADGWEFRVTEDDNASKKKNVNLDDILRRKGGLSGLVEGSKEQNESDDEDEDEEDEANENGENDDTEEGNNVDNEDDDELAMDGFGMGAEVTTREAEKEEEEEEEAEEEDSANTDKKQGEGSQSAGEEGNESEDDADSAEAIAEFYEQANKTEDTNKTFRDLDLSRPVLKGLSELNYVKPSPIQVASIPIALLGKDIVAGAVTGSGKTAAYMIPIIERLLFKPSKIAATRVIVLTPTRELAIQVCDVGRKLGRFISSLTFGLAVGGLNLRQQEQQLKTRPDIVVATPGRLIDHIRNSASFSIDSLEIMVLDEADRMLEEGFQAELTEILSLIPKHKRQTMLFSATMNTKIQDLIQLSLNKPVRIMIDPPKAAAAKLVQEFVRIRKKEDMKPALLYQLLKESDPVQQSRIVVFVAKKETAHRLRVILGLLGMKVSELHGSLTQEQRLSNVNDFKNLTVSVLICTDLAARGLDIPKIEMVINFDMPKSHEIYLHRVGRTARAGREGRSITMVGEAASDRNIAKAAIKSLDESDSNQKAVSRTVKWDEVEKVYNVLQQKMTMVDEVLEEEQAEKQMLAAEMEMNKAENLLKHEKDIYSKPKRTWFESEKDKRKSKVIGELTKDKAKPNSKKRKQIEARKESDRIHKKTKTERLQHQGKSRNAKAGKKTKKR